MARDGAGVADTGGDIRLVWPSRRFIAGQTGEKALAQCSKGLSARIKSLRSVRIRQFDRAWVVWDAHIREDFSRVSLELKLGINEPVGK